MSNTKTILGFVAGAAVGALAGVLLAPDKGTNTRKKISGKAGDMTDSLKSSFSDFIESVKDTYASSKQEASDLEDKPDGLRRYSRRCSRPPDEAQFCAASRAAR